MTIPAPAPATPTGGNTPPPSAVSPSSAQPQAPAPSPAPESPKEGEFAKHFAEVNKQMQKVRDEQKRIAELKKEMEADHAEWQKYRKAKESRDAIALLESAGLTYKDATDRLVKDKEEPETAESKIDLLLKRFEEQDRAEEARKKAAEEDAAKAEQAAADQAVEEFRGTIRSHVEQAGDRYELIRAAEAFETVLQVVESYYNENDGKMLDLETACQQVEEWLESEIRPYLSLKKFSKGETLSAEGASGTSKPDSTFTLKNKETASPKPEAASGRYLSDQESVEQVTKILRWI